MSLLNNNPLVQSFIEKKISKLPAEHQAAVKDALAKAKDAPPAPKAEDVDLLKRMLQNQDAEMAGLKNRCNALEAKTEMLESAVAKLISDLGGVSK